MNAERLRGNTSVLPVGKPLIIWLRFELIKRPLTPLNPPAGKVLPTKTSQVGRESLNQ